MKAIEVSILSHHFNQEDLINDWDYIDADHEDSKESLAYRYLRDINLLKLTTDDEGDIIGALISPKGRVLVKHWKSTPMPIALSSWTIPNGEINGNSNQDV